MDDYGEPGPVDRIQGARLRHGRAVVPVFVRAVVIESQSRPPGAIDDVPGLVLDVPRSQRDDSCEYDFGAPLGGWALPRGTRGPRAFRATNRSRPAETSSGPASRVPSSSYVHPARTESRSPSELSRPAVSWRPPDRHGLRSTRSCPCGNSAGTARTRDRGESRRTDRTGRRSSG